MDAFAILAPSSEVTTLHFRNIWEIINGTILTIVPFKKTKFLEKLLEIFRQHTFCSTKDQVQNNLAICTKFVIIKCFYTS